MSVWWDWAIAASTRRQAGGGMPSAQASARTSAAMSAALVVLSSPRSAAATSIIRRRRRVCSRPRASARSFTASMPTTSITAFVAALSEIASISRSSSARVSAVSGCMLSSRPPPPGTGASPARMRSSGSIRPPHASLHSAAEISTLIVLAAGSGTWAARSWRRPLRTSTAATASTAAPGLVLGLVQAADGAHARLQLGRVRLVDHLAGVLGGVDDAALADPDRDVVAVADQVAGLGLAQRHLAAGGLLLLRVVREEQAEAAVDGLDEAGAVEAVNGDPAPLVRRPQEHERGLGDRVAAGLAPGRGQRLGAQARGDEPCAQVAVGGLGHDDHVGAVLLERLAERVGLDPAAEAVGHGHLRPTVLAPRHLDRVGEEHLGHLFGALVGLLPDRRIGEGAGGLVHQNHSIRAAACEAARSVGEGADTRPAPSPQALLDLDGGAGLLELGLHLIGLLAGDALLHRLRRLVGDRLGLLEAEAGQLADHLDDRDLALAGRFED